MRDLGNVPTRCASADASTLTQRALACEINGDLDHAMALIMHLRRSADAAPSAYAGLSAGGERRIA